MSPHVLQRPVSHTLIKMKGIVPRSLFRRDSLLSFIQTHSPHAVHWRPWQKSDQFQVDYHLIDGDAVMLSHAIRLGKKDEELTKKEYQNSTSFVLDHRISRHDLKTLKRMKEWNMDVPIGNMKIPERVAPLFASLDAERWPCVFEDALCDTRALKETVFAMDGCYTWMDLAYQRRRRQLLAEWFLGDPSLEMKPRWLFGADALLSTAQRAVTPGLKSFDEMVKEFIQIAPKRIIGPLILDGPERQGDAEDKLMKHCRIYAANEVVMKPTFMITGNLYSDLILRCLASNVPHIFCHDRVSAPPSRQGFQVLNVDAFVETMAKQAQLDALTMRLELVALFSLKCSSRLPCFTLKPENSVTFHDASWEEKSQLDEQHDWIGTAGKRGISVSFIKLWQFYLDSKQRVTNEGEAVNAYFLKRLCQDWIKESNEENSSKVASNEQVERYLQQWGNVVSSLRQGLLMPNCLPLVKESISVADMAAYDGPEWIYAQSLKEDERCYDRRIQTLLLWPTHHLKALPELLHSSPFSPSDSQSDSWRSLPCWQQQYDKLASLMTSRWPILKVSSELVRLVPAEKPPRKTALQMKQERKEMFVQRFRRKEAERRARRQQKRE